MKFSPTVINLFLLIGLSNSAFGQVTVLINEEATIVDQKDGYLVNIYNALPNFMARFEKAPTDIFTKVGPRLLEELDRSPIVMAGSPYPDESKKMQKEIKDSSVDNTIFFKDKSSTLLDQSAQAMRSFSDKITTGESKAVLLKSWYKADHRDSQELVKDRLETCKEIMEKNGVPSNLILISLAGSSQESEFVTVLIQ